jgi:hypothetical protein
MTLATEQNVQEEVAALESEIATLKERLATEERALAALGRERAALAESIALDKAPPAKAGELARRILETEMRAEGLRTAITARLAHHAELYPILREQQAAAAHAAALAELEAQMKRAKEVTAHIQERLRQLVADDLVAYDQVRDELQKVENRNRLPNGDPVGGRAGELAAKARAALADMQLLGNNPLTHTDSELLKQGWTVRGDLELMIRNLRPPRR